MTWTRNHEDLLRRLVAETFEKGIRSATVEHAKLYKRHADRARTLGPHADILGVAYKELEDDKQKDKQGRSEHRLLVARLRHLRDEVAKLDEVPPIEQYPDSILNPE